MTPKEIADALDRAALGDPETDVPRSTVPGKVHLAEFNFDGHIIRCEPTSEAIRKVAAKYRKGAKNYGTASGQPPRTSYSTTGDPSRSHSVSGRWFSPNRLPLSQCGE